MLHFNTNYIYTNKLFIEKHFISIENWGRKVGSVLLLLLYIVYNPANYYFC